MKVFFLAFFLWFSSFVFAQNTFNGVVFDQEQNALNGVNVTIRDNQGKILGYAITDTKGTYTITIEESSAAIVIEIKSMGFASVSQSVANKTQTLDFVLTHEAFELKEIAVKTTPIRRDGDTISYSVSSFANTQDRTISDILKRLPGIEVGTDGRILYQGKPINKYYIEGLDLLGGKYHLANENLPFGEVSNVQIVENHQPIKVLDSLVFSDRAAINIKLKKGYTFTGQAKVGAGLSPLLWDANITPMLFTKNRQLLISYQSNNTGENVGAQLNQLTVEDLVNQFESNSQKTDWLALQQLARPNFSEKRWLDNNVHLFSFNYLHKLKKNYEIRLNMSYLNDYQQQNGGTTTQFITPTDRVTLVEEKYNQFYLNSLHTTLSLEKNTANNYLKNNLQFEGFWDCQRGTINLNGEGLQQELHNRYFKLNNNLKSIFAVGKQMITLNSNIVFHKTPQTLAVNPGQFEELTNNGNPFDKLLQEVDLQTFYTHNYISLTKAIKRFSFEPKVGFEYENQELQTQLSTSENILLNPEFSNRLKWKRAKAYFQLQTQYKKDKWRMDFTMPLNLHTYNIEDRPLQEQENLTQLTFEPRLSVLYDWNNFWKVNFSTGIDNQFGTINQLHYAYILQNYRNIQQINSELPQIFNRNLSAGVFYRNPIETLFGNVMYYYSNSDNNLLYTTQILENGATSLQAIEQNNTKIAHTISGRLSKYFSVIKSNITMNANVGLQEFQQILNLELSDINNKNWGFGSKIETDVTKWFIVEYQLNWMFAKNKVQNQSSPTISQQNHLLNLNLHPKENQYFALKSEYVNNDLFSQQSENFFLDMLYRYTTKKNKIDLELQLCNIFNTKNYRTVNISDFSYLETNFNLRPRQVVFKIRFSL
ncbi:hypothetical protein J2X31_003100 [Flavobacterium arsenatis]|uniref:TonB-dependent receptor n=1 Tax=Flavobacterium arsenatis TaxID=1484332 RepID=A0ABU1TT61_9FLAO|nr:carboxypeptidase-like regulatory domain-containing protein [Flavobacterium arsenatis]MDR6969074.1 hypothetical protein [Flavobacterium arsenatis]